MLADLDFLSAPSTPLILLASAWIGVWAFARYRKNKKKAAKTGEPARAISKDIAAPKGAMTASDVRALAVELQQLLADLTDTSRRMAAQMDNRHQRLEKLFAEADRKIQRLEGALRGEDEDAHDDDHADLACVTTHLNAISATIHAPCPTTKDLLHAPSDPTQRRIYDLADKGQSPRDIAQQLSKHPGEVELILALRRRSAG